MSTVSSTNSGVRLKIGFSHLFQREVQRRHDRSDRDRINRLEIQTGEFEKIGGVNAPLITRARPQRL